ncbi:MAG: alanyl-tRNA synthetase [Thermoleophilaceae bacterium]|nr:alanyl-tRNA synthetase [Thermoleophilaceae bacterium]
MRAAEIRETFLSFFEERDHRRMPSASLVPSAHDPSVLLNTAGMQPFKPYFRGEEDPPAPRLTSCQKCFRTTDIENVGNTARHLTFFEMLGNFSFGDYFKDGAIEFAYELTTKGYGFDPDKVWMTVFGGDEDLGLGPDAEAIELWRGLGVPDDHIILLGREDNFWQAGPTGPCGPCSELYLDRGLDFGAESDRPGHDSERFLEFWNCVFMQYELHEDGSLTELPKRNIDTGLGLDRMAAILQDVPSVYETDQFKPIVALGEELSGRKYGQDEPTTRALRILADHGRAMTFLLADGVVPSNEDRGYILRRIMRRAIQQGRVLEIDGAFLPGLCERVIETMGEPYPELQAERATIARWAKAEEEGFHRTLEQGERLLEQLVQSAQKSGATEVAAADAFQLHDTYGFPYELTKEMLAEQGLTVDDAAFEQLMDQARDTSRSGGRSDDGGGPAGRPSRERAMNFAKAAGFTTDFKGYESTEVETVIGALESDNGTYLAKLPESPFYAEGGGQVSDHGVVETDSGKARVVAVYRLGDDQAVALEPVEGELAQGEPARASVDRGERLATVANHTATHLLHAALRERLGTHVRQAGSYVGPDKLRFDFTHGERLSPEDVAAVEERVNGWIADNHPVHAVTTTIDEAKALGAMALFGEKYGDIVRMVEVEDVSRELCGGTHVAATAEIGLFHLTNETSSASNVRRIEAITGPESAEMFRRRTEELRELARILKVPEADVVGAVQKLSDRAKELQKQPKADAGGAADALVASAEEIAGVRVVADVVDSLEAKALLDLSDRVRQTLGESVVVLGSSTDGKVHLVANVAPPAVERGLKAGDIVRVAAQITGGGGGGRDTMAQAGGRDPAKLPEAIAAARAEIEKVLR